MKFPPVLSSRSCVLCKQHDAKFAFQGKVRRDRQHDICQRCYRSLRDRNTAMQLSKTSQPRAMSFETSSYFFRQLLQQPWPRMPKVA